MPFLSGLWLIAAILDIQEARQFLLVAMFEVVVLVALGPRVFWLLLAPLLFLFFLVPSGAFLVPTLQTITAKIVGPLSEEVVRDQLIPAIDKAKG